MYQAILVLICVGIYFVFFYKRNLFQFFRKRNAVLNENIQLENYSHYYIQLTNEEQNEFRKRVAEFLEEKEFISRGVELTDALRVKIAAYAVQITFGFEPMHLVHFETILLYPSSYLSQVTGKMYAGETHPSGAIVFSIQDLERGHSVTNDGLNLALHEFAHALLIENKVRNEEFNFINPRAIQQFKVLAGREIPLIKTNSTHFFRSYASTNEHEFFACCVENFFERTTEFRSIHPQLFAVMVNMLQQNPLNSPKRLINNFA